MTLEREEAGERDGPAQRLGVPDGRPAGAGAGGDTWRRAAGLRFLARQREATVFVVVVLLFVVLRLHRIGRSHASSPDNLIILSQDAAPIIIIALGEVLLLICGEIDLSVGFIYAFAPFLMYFLIGTTACPALLGAS